MRRPRHTFKKNRISTRDRFLQTRKDREPSPQTWFRKKSNFLVILMILVVFAFMIIVKSVYQVQDNLDNKPSQTEEMDYEQAKKIFSGEAEE
jgi:hypothetical protein